MEPVGNFPVTLKWKVFYWFPERSEVMFQNNIQGTLLELGRTEFRGFKDILNNCYC